MYDVTHQYPGEERRSLDRIRLSVHAGELVYLTGPSGSGKTTLLRLLLADLSATQGAPIVLGTVLRDLTRTRRAAHRRRIGCVFQDCKLLEDRTAAENVAYALDVLDVDGDEIAARTGDVLAAVGLTGRADAYPRQLSGGESQRVAAARALVTGPRLILADEPTGNLDPDNRDAIVDLLTAAAGHGAAVIVATHDLDVVRRHHGRHVTLVDGRITADSGARR